MAADVRQQSSSTEHNDPPPPTVQDSHGAANDDDDDEEEEEEEDEEPKLKYAKLTGSLTNVYRNGDSTSASLVAGDKLVLGTHNGNVHVLSLPSLQPLKTYHAHSATITSISVSPTPSAPASIHHLEATATVSSPSPSIRNQPTGGLNSARNKQPQTIPHTPNNNIYIATSSLDGHVCTTSLLDPKDVHLRNFARPLQAVALSPDYRNDRTCLSGGLAGQLILTVGGKAGVTIDANTNSAAAAAGGWLGSLGLGADRGRDTVLHSGEGKIGEIKWSLSGKWVCWVNEEGIKIMRSHLKLGSEESEEAWRRIAHASRPNRVGWEEGAGVWRARAQWVNDQKIETDEDAEVVVNGAAAKGKKLEKLVVGWGNTAWVMLVQEHGTNAAGKKVIGTADIVNKLHFEDCIISGITLFTSTMLAILAYRTVDDDDNPISQPQIEQKPRKGRSHRHTGLAPQLRLVELRSGDEVDVDELSISRFESLSAQDYHLGTLYISPPPPTKPKETERGALEGLWDAAGGKYATRIFSSGASVLSRSSDGDKTGSASVTSPTPSSIGVAAATPATKKRRLDAHPYIVEPGLKLFIQSPYDCILSIKRGLSDRLEWLLERKYYAEAWSLIDSRPDVVPASDTDTASNPYPTQQNGSLADFFSSTTDSSHPSNNAAEREKSRIGDLWLQQLVSSSRWTEAGRVAGKVLGTDGSRWEHWVWTFAQADQFDAITDFIPSMDDVVLPGVVYEIILGHYVHADPSKLGQLLDVWDPAGGYWDVSSVAKAVEARLDSWEDDNDSNEEGWEVLMECLAKLYLAEGRAKEALNCWIRTQNADAAFRLIREEKMLDVVAAEDVPGLLMLRVTKEVWKSGLQELREATSEAISLLVEEALRGTVLTSTVISQLEKRGPKFKPFLYFYLRALWTSSSTTPQPRKRRGKFTLATAGDEGHALVEDHADLAVELFAQYDREILLEFVKTSSVYSYENATAICERMHYTVELVHILSKTGQTKRALFLIIDQLNDVKQAISFTKENPDLWDDLLHYSMDKPVFVRGLLEEVGTAIDPVKLVRRIPEGLEIEGLKRGVERLMREFDIQFSISEGVARVIRVEVEMRMETLRAGRGKGTKFEVLRYVRREVGLEVKDPPTKVEGVEEVVVERRKVESRKVEPGECAGCRELFCEDETEPLLGFACGHVYHLSCLLRSSSPPTPEEEIDRLLADLRGSNLEADPSYSRLSVGAKLAHKQIIRNVVKGGCGVCHVPDGA